MPFKHPIFLSFPTDSELVQDSLTCLSTADMGAKLQSEERMCKAAAVGCHEAVSLEPSPRGYVLWLM